MSTRSFRGSAGWVRQKAAIAPNFSGGGAPIGKKLVGGRPNRKMWVPGELPLSKQARQAIAHQAQRPHMSLVDIRKSKLIPPEDRSEDKSIIL